MTVKCKPEKTKAEKLKVAQKRRERKERERLAYLESLATVTVAYAVRQHESFVMDDSGAMNGGALMCFFNRTWRYLWAMVRIAYESVRHPFTTSRFDF